MNKIKILFVEDDEVVSTMYRIKFEKEGYEVNICPNWLSAITQVTEYLPDIVFLDIMMPTMDGFETLRVIRSLAPSLVDMKIIMFSNLHSQEDIDKCMRLGANGFLIKANTTPKEAVELVEKLCTPKTVISLP